LSGNLTLAPARAPSAHCRGRVRPEHPWGLLRSPGWLAQSPRCLCATTTGSPGPCMSCCPYRTGSEFTAPLDQIPHLAAVTNW